MSILNNICIQVKQYKMRAKTFIQKNLINVVDITGHKVFLYLKVLIVAGYVKSFYNVNVPVF